MEESGMLFVIAWFACAMVGAVIGLSKGKPGKGAFLGLLLGPVGWILAACDAGYLLITLLLASGAALLVWGILEIEADKDRMQEIKLEQSSQDREYKSQRAAGLHGDIPVKDFE